MYQVFFIEPSVYARFNTGFFSLVLAGAFPKQQMLYIITVFISIFISASGTAVVVILSLLMLFLIMNGSVSNYIKYIALTVVVLTGVFLVAPERMLGLISHAFSSDYETQRRFASLSNNINTIMEQPYFGYGIGNALKFAPDGIYNSFVFLSMERGLVGLLFFLSTFLYVVLNLIPVCRTNVIFRFLLFMLFAEFLFLGSEAAVYFPYTYFIVGVALQALIKDKYYSYYS
ncbi:hypothetical protein [Salinivibrio costicola]|uniref:hypothetical protein n=1 Tax=Salinivibrio costicola TaxID=51367 RepID=UPI000ABB1274|nr:hypothetical protein [Salinivibrio costicola]